MQCSFSDPAQGDSIVAMPSLPQKATSNFLSRTITTLGVTSGKTLMAISAISEFLVFAEFMRTQKDEDPLSDYHQKIARAVILPLASLVNCALFAAGKVLTLKNQAHYPKNCDDLHLIFRCGYETIDEHRNVGKSYFRTNPQIIQACDNASEKLKRIENLYYTLSVHASKSSFTKDSSPYTGYTKVLEQAEEATKEVIASLAKEITTLLAEKMRNS